MKNIYYLVETDKARECADVIATFTNKAKAIKECRKFRKQFIDGNLLRVAEGSKERRTECFYITNSTDFVGEWRKVTRETIIF